jgi:glycosyltransferase involved in cell wall biosynthesis
MKPSQRKIIFLTTSLAFGGAEVQACSLATSLKLRGWVVKIISMCTPTKVFEDKLDSDKIPLYSLDMTQGVCDFKALLHLVRVLKKERPTILHSHMVHANFMARIARIFVHVPILISTAHNIYEGGYERNLWYRYTDFLCDLTTQVSKEGLKRYLEQKMVSTKKAIFVPNGVNTSIFIKNVAVRERERTILNVNHCFVWLAVGRFDKAKDYPTMISAFACLCRNMKDRVLLIVGNGNMRMEMEEFAERLGINDKVRFLGIRKDTSNLMNAADAYVMSSAWEGMPMVLLEAASSSLPIVATDVGDNREIIKEGQTGFMVPPRKAEKLAEVMMIIEKLSVEDRLAMGQRARKFIEGNYSLERIVDKWEDLYQQLILKRHLP